MNLFIILLSSIRFKVDHRFVAFFKKKIHFNINFVGVFYLIMLSVQKMCLLCVVHPFTFTLTIHNFSFFFFIYRFLRSIKCRINNTLSVRSFDRSSQITVFSFKENVLVFFIDRLRRASQQVNIFLFVQPKNFISFVLNLSYTKTKTFTFVENKITNFKLFSEIYLNSNNNF